ncbi:MAG: hypothetical protein ACYDEF_01955 [Methanosarcina sp.]
MKIEKIATIIEESSRKIAEEEDECCECCKSDRTGREFIIGTVDHLIDCELFELEKLVFELGDIAFSEEENPEEENPEEKNPEEENPDRTAFYEKIDKADKHLNAVRKFAEIKVYLEARNKGLEGQ